MNKPKCPGCDGSDEIRKVSGQRALCRSCSQKTRSVFQFCWGCQREWPRDASTTNVCKQPNCAIRAALLSVKQITDPQSSVRGCPFFRACPGCKALLTHNGTGCPNIICPQCHKEFCFRCLRAECYSNQYYYFINDFSDDDEDDDDDDDEIETCEIVNNTDTIQYLGL